MSLANLECAPSIPYVPSCLMLPTARTSQTRRRRRIQQIPVRRCVKPVNRSRRILRIVPVQVRIPARCDQPGASAGECIRLLHKSKPYHPPIESRAGSSKTRYSRFLPVFTGITGNDDLKKTIGACGLPSLAVNLGHTLLRPGNPVSCAVNACMGKVFCNCARQSLVKGEGM